MRKKQVHAPAAGSPVGPYSQAIEAAGFLFVSAEKGVDPRSGKTVEGGVAAQTAQALRNIQAILAQAGVSLEEVVRCVVYLRNMDAFAEMNQAYALFFPHNPPARSTVGVASLPLGLEVMIEATALARSTP